MHMLGWSRYRQQILAGIGELAKLSPDTVRGYGALGGAGQKTGHLDPRRASSSRPLWPSACAAMAASPCAPKPPASWAPPGKRSSKPSAWRSP